MRDSRGRFVRGHPLINPRSPLSGRFQRIPRENVPAPQPETISEAVTNDNTSRTVLTETSSTNPVISTFPETEEEIPIREKDTILDKHSLIAARVDMLLRKKIVK